VLAGPCCMNSSLSDKHIAEFQVAGSTLLACGCNNSHSGNLSIRSEDTILVTRTGAMLGKLTSADLVTIDLRRPTLDSLDRSSSECPVHWEIYRNTDHLAIAHGHALAAVTAGWLVDMLKPVARGGHWQTFELMPIDVEGALYYGAIAVLDHVPATASPELGRALAGVFQRDTVAIVRGHGVFAVAPTLESAMQRITSVNDCAELILRARSAGLNTRSLAAARYLDVGRDSSDAE
jgi:L-fuculose-phosphate aldolase